MCGLDVPARIQGKNISALLDDPNQAVREQAFCVNGSGFMLRDDDFCFIQYREDGSRGMELFDVEKDPLQFSNLAKVPGYEPTVAHYQALLRSKLTEIRTNDLEL